MVLWGVRVIIFANVKATMILGVVGSHITVNCVKILSAAQQCRCGKFVFPRTHLKTDVCNRYLRNIRTSAPVYTVSYPDPVWVWRLGNRLVSFCVVRMRSHGKGRNAENDVIWTGQTNICVRVSVIPVLNIYFMNVNSGACKLWYTCTVISYKNLERNFMVLKKWNI